MKAFVLLLAILASFKILMVAQDAKPCNPCEFRIAPSVAEKSQISRVEPIYPAEIRASGISGTVSVGYVIDKDGNAVRPICARAESDPPLNPEICSAAMAAITQWKYRPYLLNGEPREVDTLATFHYDFSQAGAPPTSKDAQKPRKLRVSQGVSEKNLIHKVQPHYPLEAKEKGIQGVVLLKVLINREGGIGSCEQVDGDPILEKAAMDAVKQWKYRPYMLKGEPVEVETVIKVSFHMQ